MAHHKKVSRRRFFKITGGALGAGALVWGGSAKFELRTPSSVLFPRADRPYSGGVRIPVAYASKCGGTAKIADRIACDLRSAGCQARLAPAREVEDLAGFQAVVLGAAVCMGRPLNDAVKLTKQFLTYQSGLPLAMFTVSLAMKENTLENAQKTLGYLEELVGLVRPRMIGLFPERIDLDTLPPLYRMFARAGSEGILADGDYRDWQAVLKWAADLQDKF